MTVAPATTERTDPTAMTTYTVRDARTFTPLASGATLDAATGHLPGERLAFLLNPPPDMGELELVITADDDTGPPGAIVMYYAAGPLGHDV
jgi:hypothetical protein